MPVPRRVYFFANGRADGRTSMRDRLGGKGANLADMTRAGLPVPPGFTLPADQCAAYHAAGRLPDGLADDVRKAVARLQKITGRRFGDPVNPLLVSVRSGAGVSMPGMMETVLNVGLNASIVAALADAGRGRFAYDSYRRLIAMYATAVDGVDGLGFEDLMRAARAHFDVDDDRHLDENAMRLIADEAVALYERETGHAFPQDPFDQLLHATEAVFKSWTGRRAVRYRDINHITGLPGTAVTVQAMVFGNSGNDSATGVAFTRDPSTGRRGFFGEFVINALGEDLVGGVRTPLNCRKHFPKWDRRLWAELQTVRDTLEQRYRDVQDFEFTIEHGVLYLLQTRTAQRTAAAAVKIAVDMVAEGLIDERTAVSRVDAEMISRLRPAVFDPKQRPAPLADGLAASPGAAVGRIAFTAAEAEARAAAGEAIILVRPETYPDDIGGFHAARGVLTSTGGMTSHAAVVARGMNRTCVVGVKAMKIDEAARRLTIKMVRRTHTFGPDDTLSIDGTVGHVYAGAVPTIPAKPNGPLRTLLKWKAMNDATARTD
ncbi:MAG TPA: PEP/pyruvate-binding domain-containing protein [Tepidisphaeraceae bacterium]|jgi:pyruvate,orthophosphate dikinase